MSFKTKNVIQYEFEEIMSYRDSPQCTEKPPNHNEILNIFHLFMTNPQQAINCKININTRHLSPIRHQRKASDPKSRRKFKIKGTWEKDDSVSSAKDAELCKNFVSLLNKITVDNYNELSVKLVELSKKGIRNVNVMNCIAEILFKRAISDFAYSSLYIELSQKLDESIPSFKDHNNNDATLGKLLITQCQIMFNKTLEGTIEENPLFEREENEHRFKMKCIGNITLIGKMFCKKKFPFKFLNECINMLLNNGEGSRPDLLELATKLISIIGKILDEEPPKDVNGKEIMDQYFEVVKKISTDKSINSRIRFMFLDLIDLRKNNWEERKNQKTIGPKTIEEIRNDVAQEQLEKEVQLAKTKSLSRSNSPLVRRTRESRYSFDSAKMKQLIDQKRLERRQ